MKRRKIALLSCIAILTVSTVSYASFIIDEKSSINSISVSAGDVTISNKFVNNYPMYFCLNNTDVGNPDDIYSYDFDGTFTKKDKFLYNITSYTPGIPLISATGNYDGGALSSIDYCLKFYLNVKSISQGNIYAYEFLDELECANSGGYNVKLNRSKYYFVEFALSFGNVTDLAKRIDAANCYISCPGLSSIIGDDTTDSNQLALKNHRIYPFNPIVLTTDNTDNTVSISKYSEGSNSASMKFAYRSDPYVNFLDPNYFFYFAKQIYDNGLLDSLSGDKTKLEFEAHFIVDVDANYQNWAYNPKFTIQFSDYKEENITEKGTLQ